MFFFNWFDQNNQNNANQTNQNDQNDQSHQQNDQSQTVAPVSQPQNQHQQFSNQQSTHQNQNQSDASAGQVDDYVAAYTPPQFTSHTPWNDTPDIQNVDDTKKDTFAQLDQVTDSAGSRDSATVSTEAAEDKEKIRQEQIAELDRILAELEQMRTESSTQKTTDSAVTGEVVSNFEQNTPPIRHNTVQAMHDIDKDHSEKTQDEKPQANNTHLDELDRILAELDAMQSDSADTQSSNNQSLNQSSETVASTSSVPVAPAAASPVPAAPADTSDTISAATVSKTAPTNTNDQQQTLESQNVFFLLGAEDGSDEEKESFLDELQQVVWEDFVDSDVEKLLSESEYREFKALLADKSVSQEDLQEKALTYLEARIDTLETILLEKALELKGEIVWERISGMKEYFAGKQDALDTIAAAEEQFKNNRWQAGATMLNSLSLN